LLLFLSRVGIGSLSDHVSRINRLTLVALLYQHESTLEVEANRIVDKVESVRDFIIEQFE
jgi:hypothetical protein